MLMKTWLQSLRNRIERESNSRKPVRRRSNQADAPRQVENLEERMLLTTLFIEQDNLGDYIQPGQGISITDANLPAGTESIVIESITLDSTAGDAISIDLSDVPLTSIAIENVNLLNYGGEGIDIDLENVTGLSTIAVEGVNIDGTGRGVDLNLDNSDLYAFTVDDSAVAGIGVSASNGTTISHAAIKENTISAQGFAQGIMLDVNQATANNFTIINNEGIDSETRDSVLINATDTELDGLTIRDNNFGTGAPVSIDFLIDGDTFNEPFSITNTSEIGRQLQRLTIDLGPTGLKFDDDPTTGRPFDPVPPSDQVTGLGNFQLNAEKTVLEIPFSEFDAGETFQWLIDLDLVDPNNPLGPGIPAAVSGDDLIGALVTVEFSGGNTLIGTMVGDSSRPDISRFVPGSGDGATNGINVNLDNAPVTNFVIDNNIIGGVSGSAVLFSAADHSTLTGVISNNTIEASGADGLAFDLEDSDFAGAILDNDISGHEANGIRFTPTVSESGIVEQAIDGGPTVIVSSDHGLQTGEQIVLQGMVDLESDRIYPANGLRTVTRLGNDRFSLNGLDIQSVSNTGPIRITAADHGLVTGDEVDIWGVTGTTTANGRSVITVIDDNTFELDGRVGNGNYTGGGEFSRVGFWIGGGEWFVPDFQADGTAKGLVTIDLQGEVASGVISGATNTSPIVITSPGHSLSDGDQIRVSDVQGNQSAIGVQTVTVIDDNTFALDGTTGSGNYSGGGFWTSNVITGASNTDPLVVTSPDHGLETGATIRIEGVIGNTAANGTHTITVIDTDSFRLNDANNTPREGNGNYAGGGFWTPFEDATVTGDRIPQTISGNSITANAGAGILVDLSVGTTFDADMTENQVISNSTFGIDIMSTSYGLGASLPLDPNDDTSIPVPSDISFNVNIGNSNRSDANTIDRNVGAGIRIQALNTGTGSFDISNNLLRSNRDDSNSNLYNGDAIHVRLEGDSSSAEATSLLARSVINGNQIGVDQLGNEGAGIKISMEERTRIQFLDVGFNDIDNNGDDGFQLRRRDDAILNGVQLNKNTLEGNAGDGIDFTATNTTMDQLDFEVTESEITNNDHYGVRIDVSGDARLNLTLLENQIDFNGEGFNNGERTGFHPDDGIGNEGAYGGIGIRGFQTVRIVVDMSGNKVGNNIGDGFSIDADSGNDTITVDGIWLNNELTGNSLTGFRNNAAAFGSFEVIGNLFTSNEEDGFRSVALVDSSFFRRRIGGSDLDFTFYSNDFSGNSENGMHIGQGVSAVIGNGTLEGQNLFNGNGEDGLKITQGSGAFLNNQTTIVSGQRVSRRRYITVDFNDFRLNEGDGIDIGHHVGVMDPFTEQITQTLEGGNLLHGDEPITDTDVLIKDATIFNNGGDGIEYLADNLPQFLPVIGGGQEELDLFFDAISTLTIRDSRIVRNVGRGIDILNKVGEDSRINIVNSDVISNGMEGVFVLNSASTEQVQVDSSDELIASLDSFYEVVRKDDNEVLGIAHWNATPNIELRVQSNTIQSNGDRDAQSRVLINQSTDTADQSGIRSLDWTPNTEFVNGSLGGLVIRVGSADSSYGWITAPDTELELGQSGVDAEVWNNTFDGNIGAEVYFDNFISSIPPQTLGDFHTGHAPCYLPIVAARDPLSRLDLVFRENTGGPGNSIDLVNGFAFLDNDEHYFKSRINVGNVISPPQDHTHAGIDPPGVHSRAAGEDLRQRNATRTLGSFFTDSYGGTPIGQDFTGCVIDQNGNGFFGYDGEGTSTWRVETDFDTDGFDQANPTFGFSDFFDVVYQGDNNLGTEISELDPEKPYRWDTGRDVTEFTGATPYSLDRGDVFNVGPGLGPIRPDALENNDSFQQAFDLGVLGGPAFSVNDLTPLGELNIETKGDRDYYQFTAAATGPMSVNFAATDLLGDFLAVAVYELDEERDTEQQALITDDAGNVLSEVAAPGTGRSYTANVTAGRSYIVEVFSNERSNVIASVFHGDGLLSSGIVDDKPYIYGTVRSYDLTIDTPAPAGGLSGGGGGSSGSSDGSESGGSDSGDSADSGSDEGNSGSGGGSAPASQPGIPFVNEVIGVVDGETRATAVGLTTIAFSEDVRNFDIEDITLTLDGEAVDISELPLTTINAEEYTIFLGDVTGKPGEYVLTIDADESEIVDFDDNGMAEDFTLSWTADTLVGDFTDGIDTDPGDGVYADVNGLNTLRSAVMEANVAPGADVITLTAGTYTLSIDGHFEDNAFVGDLDVYGTLTITGAGAQQTIIDAGDLDRIFHVHPGGLLILEGVTLRGGEAHDGGAIFNEGVLEITDSNITDSFAFSQGGGIYNLGDATLTRTGLANNKAGSRGGAIYNSGSLTLLDTTVSTNEAESRGGGIHNDSFAEFTNVTVTANHAGSRGGGVAGNSGNLSGRFSNTIVAGNLGTDFAGEVSRDRDVSGSVNSFGYNLFGALEGDENDAIQVGYSEMDLLGFVSEPIDPMLSGLTTAGDNRVFHHNPLTGSPAIDSASPDLYPDDVVTSLDVTGTPRLIDGDLDSTQNIDIGARELFFNVPVARFTANPNPAGPNEIIEFDGSISTHANAPRGRIVQYEWDFSYDPADGFNVEAITEQPTNSYPELGTVQVALRVTDDSVPPQTDMFILDIEIGAPRVPVIQSPDGTTTDLTPTITWTDTNDGEITGTFEIEITDITTGRPETVVLNVTDLTDSSFDTEWAGLGNLEPGRYKVRVRSSNDAGTSDWSEFREFDVVKMELLTPSGPIFDRTPVFTWPAIPGTSRYDLWVNSNAPGFVSQILRQPSLPGGQTSYEPIQQLGVGEYTAWIRQYDAEGNPGDWSNPLSFSITTVEITEPLSPTIDSTPPIVWTDLHSAVDAEPIYDLWVNQVGGQSQFIREIVRDTEYVPTENLPNGTYDVWVRPLTESGEAGAWSRRRTFVVNTPLQPNLISPEGIVADRTPTFEWEAVNGALTYSLWYRNITTGVAVRIHDIQGTTYTPTNDLSNGIYRWAIRALNEDGKGGVWSEQLEFNLASPELIAPVNPQVLTPTFEWIGFEEYVRYELWVNNDTTGQVRIIHETNLTDTTYTPDINLVAEHTYTAWVRAEDENGFITRWSEPFTFVVDVQVPDAPILEEPDGFAFTNFPTFTWQPVNAAASYEIIVKRIELTGQVTVIDERNIAADVNQFGLVEWDSNRSLPAADYRWWVRAINANGDIGAYSQPKDFTVVSSEAAMPAADEDGPLPGDVLPEGAEDAEYLLVSATMQSTVTPVTTVHQTTMPMTIQVAKAAESESTAMDVELLPEVDADEALAMDDVMAVLPENGLLDEDIAESLPVVSETVALPTAQDSKDDREQVSGIAAVVPIVAGFMTSRRNRKRRR